MNIPGLAAEASLYNTRNFYRGHFTGNDGNTDAVILVAAMRKCLPESVCGRVRRL